MPRQNITFAYIYEKIENIVTVIKCYTIMAFNSCAIKTLWLGIGTKLCSLQLKLCGVM